MTYEFVEGRGSQGVDVALECGRVGEFTFSLTVTTDDTSDTATAKRESKLPKKNLTLMRQDPMLCGNAPVPPFPTLPALS